MTQRLSQTTLIAISMLMLDPAETSRVARTGSRRTKPSRRARWFLIAILALLALLSISVKAAAEVVAGDRIVSSLDNPAVSPIRNNVHPLARRGADRGKVDDTLQLNRAMLMFRQTPAQQSDLDGLLADQMNPSSPNYHKWLTPEQFADRFGMSSNDLNKVTRWLREQGLTVVEVARSRTWVAFSGSAQQIAATLHTEIHHYNVNGTEHYANTVDPSLPAELAKVVLGVRFLDDFRPRPKAFSKQLSPQFTSSISGNHFLAPDDFATIYNVKGLYNSGIDGTGQKIAVVGQTDIVQSDIEAFRSASGLSPTKLQVILVPGSRDPGIVAGDITEADLDIEWAGAVARNATIVYVNSGNGAFDALTFAVSNDVAPVISISFGNCEQVLSSVEINSLAALAQQANAQGQTIVAAAGDSGAADCDFGTPTAPITSATHGLSVDIPAALPFVTGVGGSQFNEGTGTFWSTTNSSTGESALSYIPERAWNNTIAGGPLSSGGGGRSTHFAKPVWQAGNGVPNDNVRDVPDVSLSASPGTDGYLVCSQGKCVNGFRAADSTLDVVGGTSVGAPTFAGFIALVNQKNNAAQGNVNPILYSAAASSPAAFHDIVDGDNKVPCTAGTPDCATGTTSIGFSTGPGYDLATGLGSVDVSALAAAWAGPSQPGFQLAFAESTLSLTRGTSVTDSGRLVALGGFTGTVAMTCSVSSSVSGVTCSILPAVAKAGDAITLTATVPQTAALHLAPSVTFGWPAGALVFGGVVLAGGKRKSRKRQALLFAFLGLLVIGTVSCSGVASKTATAPGTTPPVSGSGVITVQATSGTVIHSVQLPITFN